MNLKKIYRFTVLRPILLNNGAVYKEVGDTMDFDDLMLYHLGSSKTSTDLDDPFSVELKVYVGYGFYGMIKFTLDDFDPIYQEIVTTFRSIKDL